MDYKEALSYIHNTLKFGSKLGLHNITHLLELMGNPHKRLKFVHVAGTNGKGSTVAFISSVLIESGYNVGIFTSPYIEHFRERIRINKEDISEIDLARITGFVKSKVDLMLKNGENHPTEFEIVTAIAFQYYYERQCDIVVLEVGLGGRLDSTNVIDTPLVSVITTISYDHMDILGSTLPQIAYEKAGIIKEGGDTVLYPQNPEAEPVFEQACLERNSLLHKVDFRGISIRSFGIDGQVFDYQNSSENGTSYDNLRIGLLGEHQVNNAVVAVKALELLAAKGYDITEKSIREGLAGAVWKGRFEILNKSPLFIIDGAHNLEGAKSLSRNLANYFPEMNRIFILGLLKDKDYMSILDAVMPYTRTVITVTPKSERALPATELANIIKGYCNDVLVSDTIEEAVEAALKMASEGDLVCAFGSLYYIGHVRKIFSEKTTRILK